MSILDRINSSDDVKKLNTEELSLLCDELRSEILKTVSQNGGHLASNLGVVELMVAIHRSYNTAVDRLVFDVGHQCYVHKLLTGRRGEFSTLRTLNGISGFPKPSESVDDAFIAGHSSNSISVALGMAKARSIQKDDYKVLAVIGDGAMTGGLAYEGMCNAASSGEDIVIILNDNKMSIDSNVGGMASLLQHLRTQQAYFDFKKKYRSIVKYMPAVYSFNHSIKESLKNKLLPSNIFSDMGFYYLGPIDGHDLSALENALRWVRDIKGPVLLHVLTQKGKGYQYAEERPDIYHGVSPFCLESGVSEKSGDSFSEKAGAVLCECAEENEKLFLITAAMSAGTGTEKFHERFPQRFQDVGIAEEHAVSMAAGMAKQGMVPVFAVYSSFLQRAYDMLIHDVSLLKLHVVFCIDRCGIIGTDGETHHGVFDLAFLKTVPNMVILSPASLAELQSMLQSAVSDYQQPIAVRYPRGNEGAYREDHPLAEYTLRSGEYVTVVSYGIVINQVLEAAEILSTEGINVEIIKLGVLFPNQFSDTLNSLRKTGRLMVVEDVCDQGCIGNDLLSAAEREAIPLKDYRLINVGNGIVRHGSVSELYEEHHMSGKQLVQTVKEMLLTE